MMGLKVVSVLSLCLALASCKVMNLEINAETELCSSTQAVTKDKEVTVMAKGSIPMTECTIKFDTNDQTKECGICFQFENYAYFNTTEASIVLTSGPMSKVIDATGDFPSMYMCSDETSLSLTLDHTVRYVYDPKEPGYNFILDVYNKCGYRGTAKSVPFSEVVKHAKGYHHGEEKEDREISSLVTGLVVGLCLASMFLIVLLIAYCYVKNSPNRGASKSAVSGKRTMDPSAPRSAPKSDVEMVAYKKEGDRPEGKPLLTGAAAAVVIATEDKKTKKRDRKNSNSSGSSSSNSSHGNDDVQADEKKGLIEPTVTITSEPSAPSESHTTSGGGGDSGVGGGSSDYTSGGGGSSDHTSSYGGGGGFSDYSSGGGGSCGGGGGGGGSCGGGGGSDD